MLRVAEEVPPSGVLPEQGRRHQHDKLNLLIRGTSKSAV